MAMDDGLVVAVARIGVDARGCNRNRRTEELRLCRDRGFLASGIDTIGLGLGNEVLGEMAADDICSLHEVIIALEDASLILFRDALEIDE